MYRCHERPPLPADSTTMPMQTKLRALNIFCKAMLSTGQHESDPDANLQISDYARRLAQQQQCDLSHSVKLAARSYNWIRLLSQSSQPNLVLLAEAEIRALASNQEFPPHLAHYEAERRSMTLRMILEVVRIYTEEAPMEPAEFQLAALLVSQTLQALGMDPRIIQDVVNGAAQHLQ